MTSKKCKTFTGSASEIAVFQTWQTVKRGKHLMVFMYRKYLKMSLYHIHKLMHIYKIVLSPAWTYDLM